MIIRKSLCFLLVALVLLSCDSVNQKENSESENQSKKESIRFADKTELTINPFTGDSTATPITIHGDTIETGKAKTIHPSIVNLDSLPSPKVKSFSAPAFQPAYDHIHFFEEIPKEQVISANDVKILSTKDVNSEDVITTSEGDTVETGVPYKVQGKVVQAKLSEPTRALPPRYRDDASLNIKYMNVDQGLIYSGIVSCMQDRKGNMWIGTYGLGATRYDGQFFTSISTEEGIVGDNVFAMEEDRNGNIWFGTLSSGLSVFNGTEFIHYTEKEGLPYNRVWSIKEDHRGNIWIGTNQGGVTKFEPSEDLKTGTFTVYSKKEGLSGRDVRSIDIDSDGHLWFATLGGGICEFIPEADGGSFRHFGETNGLSSRLNLSIMVDHEDKVWVGSLGAGLNVIQPPENGDQGWISKFNTESGLSNNYVSEIVEDSVGRIWIGTLENGVTMFNSSDPGKLEQSVKITTEEGLTNGSVYGLAVGNNGKIWIGSNGGGLNIYDPESFISFESDKITNSDYVYALHQDKNGRIWFGSRNGALSVLNESSDEKEPVIGNYGFDSGLPGGDIIDITESHDNLLWMATDGGGVKILEINDDLSGTYYGLGKAQGLLNTHCWSIVEDQKQQIWIATYGGGLNKFDRKDNTLSRYTISEGFPDNNINCLYEDSKGVIWCGTQKGLCKIEEKNNQEEITVYTELQGLSSNSIVNIYEDSNGLLWLGTGNCLNLIYEENNEQRLTYLSHLDGIAGHGIATVNEDRNGNIWVGTENGISVLWYDASDPYFESPAISSLGRLDGVKGLSVLNGSGLLDQSNTMWWGNGVVVANLDLTNFHKRIHPPKTSFNYLEINGQFYNFKTEELKDSLSIDYSVSEKMDPLPKKLILPHYLNHLTFYFNAIDWNAPHKISYSYRMLPLNDQWTALSPENKADYRNLSYGDYTFEVRTVGESKEWGEIQSFKFSISPPWWHTTWARIMYILSLILFVYALIKIRTRTLNRRKIELEAEVDKATGEIMNQRDEIQLAHEQLEERHQEISDSIAYAKRLQQAILPSEGVVQSVLKDAFILYKPKNVVSGDFYWVGKLTNGDQEKVYVAAADCTGHGVPGAMVSVVCCNALDKTIHEKKIENTGLILDDVREEVISKFKRSGDSVKDGMDIALCLYDFEKRSLQYSGANNPIWIIRKRSGQENVDELGLCTNDHLLIEIKASKQPVGQYENQKPFEAVDLQLQEGDIVYSFSDGIADQFGGEKGKKFKYKPLKLLLLEICGLSMKEQKEQISHAFESWKGDYEQVDDVCMIGVKV